MAKERHGLLQNKTWILVSASPVIHKPIDYRWIYKLKPVTGDIDQRYRTRLAAKGYQQKQGMSFDHSYGCYGFFHLFG